MRTSGILLPISSLPSPGGIGTMGAAAREFVDFLHAAGQHYWQILPVCPTSYGDTPINPSPPSRATPTLSILTSWPRPGCLRPRSTAQSIGRARPTASTMVYCTRSVTRPTPRLRPSAGQPPRGLRAVFGGQRFLAAGSRPVHGTERLPTAVSPGWSGNARCACANRPIWIRPAAIIRRASISGRLCSISSTPRWKELKAYANARGVEIIGDLPIYVAADSVDVWSSPQEFQLDENLLPIEVAGCPPDGFSATGQLWGNPLFDWDAMAATGYRWWVRRIRHLCSIYDLLRIDHFRGFAGYYAIPYGDKTAEHGRWRTGPGYSLFAAVKKELGSPRIIAEDLGFLTDDVRELLAKCEYPGMKVLEFAFDSRDGGDYRPHSYPTNCVAYTGTHDNEPVQGWFATADKTDTDRAVEYLNLTKEEGYHWGMMRGVWASTADLAVVQAQDVLGLGHESRMNTPSTLGGNWCWRALPGASPRRWRKSSTI